MGSRVRYYLTSIPTILGQIENWYVLFLLLLGKRRAVLRLRNGCRFIVRSLMDAWIVKETCLDREYEAKGTRIEDGWTVVDVGAGIGDFAVCVARRNPGCRIYAFEPFRESFELLEQNIALNGVRNVTPFQVAVGARSGRTRLLAAGEAVQYTTVPRGDSSPALEVEVVSLEEAFEQSGITHCDFLKIDCEGCEFETLLDAHPTVFERIQRICVEYHDGFTDRSHGDLADGLRRRGFQVQVFPNPVHGHLGLLYAYR